MARIFSFKSYYGSTVLCDFVIFELIWHCQCRFTARLRSWRYFQNIHSWLWHYNGGTRETTAHGKSVGAGFICWIVPLFPQRAEGTLPPCSRISNFHQFSWARTKYPALRKRSKQDSNLHPCDRLENTFFAMIYDIAKNEKIINQTFYSFWRHFVNLVKI